MDFQIGSGTGLTTTSELASFASELPSVIVSESRQQKKERGNSSKRRVPSLMVDSRRAKLFTYFMKKSDGPLQV